MKQIRNYLVLVLLAFTGNAMADELVIPDFEIEAGGQCTVSVELDNTENEFIMLEFYFHLPDGITVARDASNELMYSLNTARTKNSHQLEIAEQAGGNYHVLLYSSRNEALVGTSGEVFSMTLEAESTTALGSYSDRLFNQIGSDPDKNRITFPEKTFNFTVIEYDGFVKFDETATALPNYTGGETANVRMTRTIKAGVWNTIVLPFTLTATQAKDNKVFGPNVELAEFTGFTTEYDADDLDDVTPNNIVINFATYTLSGRKPMTGGKPFLIRTDRDISVFEVEGAKLVSEVTDVEGTDTEYGTHGRFTGSFVKTVVPEDGLFISNNLFYYSRGTTNMKAFRGWFELGAVLNKETTDFSTKIRFTIDDEATEIEGMEAEANGGDVYTLQGVFVGSDVDLNTLPKGVYIVGGRKVLVK